ncbi:MAG: hypothetical protein H0W87_04200 [Actinobacteria bacterium]|nr:hypothetical protein [Actinomycetota bacterium]
MLRRLAFVVLLVLFLAGSGSAANLAGTTPSRATRGCLTQAQRRPPETADDWVVCIRVSRTTAPVGAATAHFVAETNGKMNKGNRTLVIRDQTAGQMLKSCKHERICAASDSQSEPGQHRYYAAVLGGKKHVPHSKQVVVSWVATSLKLTDYVRHRGPDQANPAKLCDSEAAATDCTTTVGLGIDVEFWVQSGRAIPSGSEIRVVAGGLDGVPVAAQTNLGSCDGNKGCWIGFLDGEKTPINATFTAELFNDAGHLVAHSDPIELDWLDWTPAIEVTPGTRQCDGGGRNCYYTHTAVTARVKQPLRPGVVIVINPPYGSCGPSGTTVTQCTVGPVAGQVPVGTKPKAQVFLQTNQPFVEYGSAVAPALP